MKKILSVLVVLIAAYFGWDQVGSGGSSAFAPPGVSSDQSLADAFKNRRSDFQVEGVATIVKVLRDDNDGSRHQKMIVELDSGQTLLIAHNIDVAPRVEKPAEGEIIRFFGEYEWSEQGGVLHWTHRDAAGRHPHGWLEYSGRRYE